MAKTENDCLCGTLLSRLGYLYGAKPFTRPTTLNPANQMLSLTFEEIAGIPCVVHRDDQLSEAPVLIHYHGWTSDKSFSGDVRAMAGTVEAGFIVVMPDCVEHGDRKTDAREIRAMFNGWAVICDAMERTRQEGGALLDAVLGLPYVSAVRPQVGGVSMGGFIAQMVFAEEKRYMSMTSIVGRSSFYQADEWCRRAQAGTWCDEWCAEFATQSHPERFIDRPVLFMDGEKDAGCPPAVNAETVRLINAAGGVAEHFVEPGFGHGFSEAMQARYIAWLVKHRDAGSSHA